MLRWILLHLALSTTGLPGWGKNTNCPDVLFDCGHKVRNEKSIDTDIACKLTKEPTPRSRGLRTVVLDAGHGGHDPGCAGKHSREKEITLGLVKELGRQLKEKYPELNIIYTRTTDVFIPLHERASIANKAQADVFISIHCNYVKRPVVSGTETYVMGLHTAEENLNVAKRENSAILMEEDYGENYEGYDPNSPEGHIILSMYQNAFLEQSIQLAHFIEDEFQRTAGRSSRGVKQAGFLVLRRTSMPSVLIESGFLSNAQEEAYLLSIDGQKQMASCIGKAFGRYVAALPAIEDFLAVEKGNSGPAASATTGQSITAANTPAAEVATIYRIQLGASQSGELHKKNAVWKKVDGLEVIQEGKMYKYLSGKFSRYEEALEAKKSFHENGFPGCFVVAYRENRRIDVREAISGH